MPLPVFYLCVYLRLLGYCHWNADLCFFYVFMVIRCQPFLILEIPRLTKNADMQDFVNSLWNIKNGMCEKQYNCLYYLVNCDSSAVYQTVWCEFVITSAVVSIWSSCGHHVVTVWSLWRLIDHCGVLTTSSYIVWSKRDTFCNVS